MKNIRYTTTHRRNEKKKLYKKVGQQQQKYLTKNTKKKYENKKQTGKFINEMSKVLNAVAQENDLKTEHTIIRNLTENIQKINNKIKDNQRAVIRSEHGIVQRSKEYFKEIYLKEEPTININKENEIKEMKVTTEETTDSWKR